MKVNPRFVIDNTRLLCYNGRAMRATINIIFSIVCSVLCVAGSIYFLGTEYFFVGGAFFLGFIAFMVVFARNYKQKKLYVNPYNALPKDDAAASERDAKQRIRKNLLSYGYELRDGFYVLTKNKYYDVYFSTYDKDNVMSRVDELSRILKKDGTYLEDMLKHSGYADRPIDVEKLHQTLVGGVTRYDNARLYTPKKQSYVILVGFFNHTEPKPMYSFWMLPFNSVQSVDQLDFVDFSAEDGVVRLNTGSFERNPLIREQIRKIFKGVVDFDGEVPPTALPDETDDLEDD